MKKRGVWIICITALLLAAGGGYVAYTRTYDVEAQEPEEEALQTTMVSRGDITLTVSGTGELIPAAELDLTFRTSGLLQEIFVETGDQVEEGHLLARLETGSLERALMEADTDLQIAELELGKVREGPSDAEIADAEARVRDAQTQLTLAYDAYQEASDGDSSGAVESAKTMYDWWVGYYQSQKAEYEAGKIDQTKHDYAMAAMIEAEETWERAKNQSEISELQALTSFKQARNSVAQAQEDLELLQSQPLTDTLMAAELKVDEAALAREEAEANLEAARLYAPFSGTVMDVGAKAGERVGASTTILTLASLHEPLLRFWLEESDMTSLASGNQVNVVFDALPDITFTGTVARVDPILVTVSGTPAVQAQASLYLDDRNSTLLSGMTADVEVIAAEAQGTLLIPLGALEEGPEGCYLVSVVKQNGQLEEREVEVGLRDALNAEILSGLELGEIVVVNS